MLLLALLLPHPAATAWPTDPTVNVPLCTAAENQHSPAIIPDGVGGAFVTWDDYRTSNRDIYAQRISAGGVVQWTSDGVALCTAAGSQSSPTIISDGDRGAIVTWQDSRNGNNDIYAQRISAAGTVQWTANGVALCTAAGDQYYPKIVSDGAGGAIAAWTDARSGNYDIYAQRVSADGTVLWTTDGVALCVATDEQSYPSVVSDGAGGAIVTWQDLRSSYTYFDIYAQRVSAGGVVQWTANGVALCTAPLSQFLPMIVSDSVGEAIVSWEDSRSGSYRDIYAQRISAAGTVQWTADGVALCTAAGYQYMPRIVSDGMGGAIVAWWDLRSDYGDIYAQRISAVGTVLWAADGVPLCTAAGQQYDLTIASDGAGGAMVAWEDIRSGTDKNVYTQSVSADGTVLWTADGAALCSAAGEQWLIAITSDGAGGAIVAWEDWRSGGGSNSDIYAQRVLANGQLGGDSWVSVQGDAAPAFALDHVRPNPTRGGPLTVRFALPSGTAASLELLDVAGRRITAREVGSLGAGQHSLDLGEGRHLAPGLYLVHLRWGTDTRVTRVVVLK